MFVFGQWFLLDSLLRVFVLGIHSLRVFVLGICIHSLFTAFVLGHARAPGWLGLRLSAVGGVVGVGGVGGAGGVGYVGYVGSVRKRKRYI